MTVRKQEAYERALTLFGRIFFNTPEDDARFFLGTIKMNVVLLFYALIIERETDEGRNPLFPKSTGAWRFGDHFIVFEENNSELWDTDKEYFTMHKQEKRSETGVAVLNYGVDLERFASLEEIQQHENVSAVFGATGNLGSEASFAVLRKRHLLLVPAFYRFIFRHTAVLIRAYRVLVRHAETSVSLVGFLRYLWYPAFQSARFRGILALIARRRLAGTILFSDMENSTGDSWMLWSMQYGFRTKVYSHGSSLHSNQRRYFAPDTYYVYTTHHERAIENAGFSSPEVVLSRSRRIQESRPAADTASRQTVRRAAFITGMERNCEAPFTDTAVLMRYAEQLAAFFERTETPFVIKSHKLRDWHEQYDALARHFSTTEHIKTRWSGDDLENIDVGILASTETTLTLQLMQRGIPVVTCAEIIPAIRTEHFFDPLFPFVARSEEDVLRYLERLMQDEDAYREASASARRTFCSFMPQECGES